MDVKQLETTEQEPVKRRRWLVAAAASAVAVVVVGGGALLLTSGDAEPVALTPETLAGNEFRVVGGFNQMLPARVVLGEDGTFEVIDIGKTIDAGTYTIEGDQISFVSVWAEGHNPEGYGIQWANDECPECPNRQLKADKCEGIVGEYQLLFEEPSRVAFKAVWDECQQRVVVASGLELELAGG